MVPKNDMASVWWMEDFGDFVRGRICRQSKVAGGSFVWVAGQEKGSMGICRSGLWVSKTQGLLFYSSLACWPYPHTAALLHHRWMTSVWDGPNFSAPGPLQGIQWA